MNFRLCLGQRAIIGSITQIRLLTYGRFAKRVIILARGAGLVLDQPRKDSIIDFAQANVTVTLPLKRGK